MNNSDQHLEQLFNDNLGSQFEIQGSTSWKQLQVRRNKGRFLRFNYNTLNIYYIAIVGCTIITAMLFFANKPNSKDVVQPQPIIVKQTIISPKTTHTQNTIEDTKTNIPIEATKHELPKKNKNVISNSNNNISVSQNKSVVPIVIAVDSTPKTAVIPPKQEDVVSKKKIIKTVVVVQKNEVMIKDTVLNVVTKKVRKRN
jgi:hypothetical protein